MRLRLQAVVHRDEAALIRRQAGNLGPLGRGGAGRPEQNVVGKRPAVAQRHLAITDFNHTLPQVNLHAARLQHACVLALNRAVVRRENGLRV